VVAPPPASKHPRQTKTDRKREHLSEIACTLRRRYGLVVNAAAEVEKPRQRLSGDIAVFSPEEVWAQVRAAESIQDGAVFLTAAFTGLRLGELIALRRREVDFTGSVIRVRASYSAGALRTPKSGKVRSVPMVPDVAAVLARLSDRGHCVGDDELVFPSRAVLSPRR
jgi:integrase